MVERFFWRDHDLPPEERTIDGRFPEGIRGYQAWRRLVHSVADDPFGGRPESLRSAFDTFLAAVDEDAQPRLSTCCLFISHRMNDVNNALHIARVATQCGYDYWLDIHDPTLTRANRIQLSSPAKEVLIAAIIEIALLNVTNVIALHTNRSAGSKWIPYELGRAKTRLVHSDRAAGWYHPSSLANSRAEYMYLVEATTTDAEIRGWLSRAPRSRLGQSQCVLRPEVERLWKYGDHPPPMDPP
jgi:hypothetical protein